MTLRVFTMADQAAFARWSGDSNPMHVDAVAARRTVAGAPAVHGMHLVLWALDTVAADLAVWDAISLEVRLSRFVLAGAPVRLAVEPEGERLVLRVHVDDGVAATMVITRAAGIGHDLPPVQWKLDDGPERTVATQLDVEDLAGLGGVVADPAARAEGEAAFPQAVHVLPEGGVVGLLLISRLVGMVCPGENSVLSEVSLAFGSGGPMTLQYAVRALDTRFRVATIGVVGRGLAGTVRAVVRRAPVEQASVAELRAVVRPNEFAGQVALVVGGSRGLGELTAKILAAGGASTIVTYARGAADAAAVGAALRREGTACRVQALDVEQAVGPQVVGMGAVTQIYYFATPQIFRQGGAAFDDPVLAKFLRYYVGGFEELCSALRPGAGGQDVTVFYPSSVAVESRPRGMTEYAMAKAAGEVLCRDVDRWGAGLRVVVRRLPRLLTDQTATTMPVGADDARVLLLEAVRAVQRRHGEARPQVRDRS